MGFIFSKNVVDNNDYTRLESNEEERFKIADVPRAPLRGEDSDSEDESLQMSPPPLTRQNAYHVE